ncbi:MAG: ATP-dependent metalloprotease, partial [Rhodanobacter sp.]
MLWVIIAVVLFTVFESFNPRGADASKLAYSTFVQNVDSGNVSSATISADQPATISGKLKDGSVFRTVVPVLGSSTNAVVKQMQDKGVEVRQDPSEGFSLIGLLVSWLPVLLIVGVFIWFMRQMQSGGGGRGAMSFGR